MIRFKLCNCGGKVRGFRLRESHGYVIYCDACGKRLLFESETMAKLAWDSGGGK